MAEIKCDINKIKFNFSEIKCDINLLKCDFILAKINN